MGRDWLNGVKNDYDVVVIGSGLAGLTAAKVLAKRGHSVLLLEQYANFGGLATWFVRSGGHVFDISLHGFPAGMMRMCRRYWTHEIADSIVPVGDLRYDNPQFELRTRCDAADLTRILTERFAIAPAAADGFFAALRAMTFLDDPRPTVRQLFAAHFPGRSDVLRLLFEPIAYANGCELDDPAISYGIVFSAFVSQGVHTFRGGTGPVLTKMRAELRRCGVDLRSNAKVEKIVVRNGRACGVRAAGRTIGARAVLSNASLAATLGTLLEPQRWAVDFVEEARAVRQTCSSCQVYLGIRKGAEIERIGDQVFSSSAPVFDSGALCARGGSSRTFSMYYPDFRPATGRSAIVSSTNARYADWAGLSDDEYRQRKRTLIDDTLDALEKYLPDVRAKVEHAEAATPLTFERYTGHASGATFGTKLEGLRVSMRLPQEIPGLFHAGAVGGIMSGWLGTVKYGVIVANAVYGYLRNGAVNAFARPEEAA
jgi:phytoene dehydrogenase-like protein